MSLKPILLDLPESFDTERPTIRAPQSGQLVISGRPVGLRAGVARIR